MPATYTRSFRIRQYECDAQGHLNHANYARFMQEAAIEASAAVGWDMARYEQQGSRWIIRETEIEHLAEVRYGQTLEVRTRVGDFRRVRSRRFYEFTLADTGQPAARASTDWIYINMATGAPEAIPPDMVLDFMPEGAPDKTPPREKQPLPPPQPAGTFRLRRRVEWRDIDALGHLNNAVYFDYIGDSSTQVGRHFGWPMERVQQHGFAIFARQQHISYLQPAHFDDELEIATWVSDVKRATALRHYSIVRVGDGALLAQARALWVWVDLATHRPIRIPPEFGAAFASNIAEG